ncbi:MAG TPA: hypothetical protein VED20_13770, partial [Streptosporangiaceae bacterium]|nr:hypothetical protein [Streptosporangiaceae bacterium]
HTGSCVGVHVIEGHAWNEPLTVGEPPAAREYGPGETFWFPGEGIHRMDHQAGAVTIHVYSPPIQAIGHYDLYDGQLRRTQVWPDQPSPPSIALYEALHRPAGTDRASGPAPILCRCVGAGETPLASRHVMALDWSAGACSRRSARLACELSAAAAVQDRVFGLLV